MFLITNCGFGINMSWDDPDYDDKGDWTPNHIIHKVSKLVLVRSVLPDILFNNIPANVYVYFKFLECLLMSYVAYEMLKKPTTSLADFLGSLLIPGNSCFVIKGVT
jgi:hypothetical protein